jgi:hypothetical protein
VLIEAARTVIPAGAVVTSVTALQQQGVAVGPVRPLHFVTTHRHPVRRTSIKVTRVSKLPPHRGAQVTAEHAFASAAVQLDLVELVTAGDWLLRLGCCSLMSLRSYAASSTGRGGARARRAAALVRERVDSPRETRLRLLLVLAGLPDPECNVLVGTDDRPIGRVDLVYQQFRVIIEYEGDQHRSNARQWNTDIHRHEDFAEGGYTLVRITALRMRRPRDVVRRVFAALRCAGHAGPEPRFSAEWCQLFES